MQQIALASVAQRPPRQSSSGALCLCFNERSIGERPVPLRDGSGIHRPDREKSFPLFCGLVNQNAPTVDPETALVMPEFDAEETTRSKDDLRGRGGSSIKLRTTLRTETAGVPGHQVDPRRDDDRCAGEEPEFQTIDAPRMVRWSF
jgi:hypothetical protein